MFCKQKTAYDMRLSDWSSDVCSSDLVGVGHDDAMILRAAHGLYALARLNAAPVDIMRDVGRTDAADALDIGVVENGVDHFLVAMNDLKNAIGTARFLAQFGEAHGNGGVTLGRLQDEGGADCKGDAAHPDRKRGG